MDRTPALDRPRWPLSTAARVATLVGAIAVAGCADPPPTPEPPVDLSPAAPEAVGGRWVPLGASPGRFVEFPNAAQATGHGGCNAFAGRAQWQGRALRIGPLAATRRACASPAEQKAEDAFLAALEATRHARIDERGDLLLSTGPGRPVLLRLTRAAAPAARAAADAAEATRLKAWACLDGTRFTSRFEPDGTFWLERDGQPPERLRPTVSASGARATNERWQYWEHQGSVSLQRLDPPSAATTCTEDRPATLRAQAARRGVYFRATGNEPGWVLELGPGHRLTLDWRYGERRFVIPDAPAEPGATRETSVHQGVADGQALRVELSPGPCTDDMSGAVQPVTVRLQVGERTVRGCGGPTAGPSVGGAVSPPR